MTTMEKRLLLNRCDPVVSNSTADPKVEMIEDSDGDWVSHAQTEKVLEHIQLMMIRSFHEYGVTGGLLRDLEEDLSVLTKISEYKEEESNV